MTFQLHPQLETDTHFIADLNLCRLLLMNDGNYPWVILVPKKSDITEIYQLSPAEQQLLIKEIDLVSKKLTTMFKADKINIAALGNVVPQLHIHIIARHKKDLAWPKPVWGVAKPTPYSKDKAKTLIKQLQLEFI